MTLEYGSIHVDIIIYGRIDEQDWIHDMLSDQGTYLSTGISD